jgi:hypothetical protein
MSPRWFDKRVDDHLALDTGGGPIARLWSTALSGLVDIGYVKATGNSVKIRLPKSATKPEVEFEWKIPQWSNAIERNRARSYFQAYAAAIGLFSVEQALKEVYAGHGRTWSEFRVPRSAVHGARYVNGDQGFPLKGRNVAKGQFHGLVQSLLRGRDKARRVAGVPGELSHADTHRDPG